MSDFIEDFVGKVPGSFVAMAPKPPLTSSVGSVISVVQSPEKKFTTESTESTEMQREDPAVLAVRHLMLARGDLSDAMEQLRCLATDQRKWASLKAAGFDIFNEYRGPCMCGVPGCTRDEHTIDARVNIGGKDVVIKFEV